MRKMIKKKEIKKKIIKDTQSRIDTECDSMNKQYEKKEDEQDKKKSKKRCFFYDQKI